MSDTMITRHRPAFFEDVVGQREATKGLKKILDNEDGQSFILSGPSGCGKTTIARIAAAYVGCDGINLYEVDAATHSGIDNMRELVSLTMYTGLGSSVRVFIIDEAHSLSKAAWQSLLKTVEEPPKDQFWFFCTTEPGKIPQTIKTRCASFDLKLVKDNDLLTLVRRVAKEEKIKIRDIEDLLVKEAAGSPRQLLVNLATCAGETDRKVVASLLKTAVDHDQVRALCQKLVQGASWSMIMGLVNKLEDTNPESIRIIVCNYTSAVLKKSKTEKQACHLLNILDAFSTPYNPSERTAPLLLSIGRVIYD